MEARGNSPSYPGQGVNVVRSSLNYGPLKSVQTHIFGWWSQKQSSYDKDFHVYTMEWTPDWMRFYVDSRLQAMVNLKITGKGGKDFFKRGNYPGTATNGSSVAVVVENIWEQQGGSAAAPFDQGEQSRSHCVLIVAFRGRRQGRYSYWYLQRRDLVFPFTSHVLEGDQGGADACAIFDRLLPHPGCGRWRDERLVPR